MRMSEPYSMKTRRPHRYPNRTFGTKEVWKDIEEVMGLIGLIVFGRLSLELTTSSCTSVSIREVASKSLSFEGRRWNLDAKSTYKCPPPDSPTGMFVWLWNRNVILFFSISMTWNARDLHSWGWSGYFLSFVHNIDGGLEESGLSPAENVDPWFVLCLSRLSTHFLFIHSSTIWKFSRIYGIVECVYVPGSDEE